MTELAEACEKQQNKAMRAELPASHRASTIRSQGTDFLYLFACWAMWHRVCSQEAFRELFCARMSSDQDTRLVSRAFLELC
jgi:hypothetical protein